MKLRTSHLSRVASVLRSGRPLLLGLAAAGGVGCLERPIQPNEPRTTSTIIEKLTQSSVDKIDILLSIDNSRSMADKQDILSQAIPDLVKGLVNPLCIDPETGIVDGVQPAGPLDPCQNATSKREFEPVVDIHIGIISSSLGGLLNACDTSKPNNNKVGLNDKGRLLSREDANGTVQAETYLSKGFLAWDPTQKKLPKLNADGSEVPGQFDPGEADLDGADGADPNGTSLIPTLTDMVKGVSQFGCGYEAQLEATYRFLVEPSPPDQVVLQGSSAVPQGQDMILLQQRRDFLRPDSLVAIVLLSDENDCSIIQSGPYWVAGRTDNGYHLPPARSECATDPNDPCCLSCAQGQGSCPVDANCSVPALSAIDDQPNARCFNQKQRFGIDFLYPISRYTEGFSSVTITAPDGSLLDNPLFTDLNPKDSNSAVRDPSLVFFAGIVGVPWQDIARDPNDLTKGFKDPDEMLVPDPSSGFSAWDVILGDPANGVKPKDPLMIETNEVRIGGNFPATNPVTGDAPTLTYQGNPINGNEYDIPNKDDLQYACIFQLPTPRDCTDPNNNQGCDCPLQNLPEDQTEKPLCDDDPANDHIQTHAKAYPGVRELQLVKSMGGQGIVGSVCPKQLTDNGARDFGYRPAIQSIIDRLKTKLGGQCLPRTLQPDANGQVQCLILEARKAGAACTCDLPGRDDVPPLEDGSPNPAITAALADPAAGAAGWDCFCAVTQLSNTQDANNCAGGGCLNACQSDVAETPLDDGNNPVDGWCYIDATVSPPIGNVQIVQNCPPTERRLIRFVGDGGAQPGATLFITCAGDA